MNKPLILLALASILCLAGCGDSAAPAGNTGHTDHTGHNHGETTPETDSYPLKTCVVSGEELGSMGDAVVLEHEGQEVRLCCQGCVATFNSDPAKFLAKLKTE